MSAEYTFIVNPISGLRFRGEERRRRVEAFIVRSGIDAACHATDSAGHATRLALAAVESGSRRVICVGGDGTINETAKALIDTDVAFGLVPMGSGNGLARHLGVPLRFDDALANVVEGAVDSIDVGEADGQPFFNVMGFGFDAEIARRFNEAPVRGFVTYLREGWGALMAYRSERYRIEWEEGSCEQEAFFVAVANSAQYGNDAFIAPGASIRDGLLDMVVVTYPGFFRFANLVRKLFARSILKSPHVKLIRSTEMAVSLPGPGFFHADGEIFACGEKVRVRTRPLALKVIVPSSRVRTS